MGQTGAAACSNRIKEFADRGPVGQLALVSPRPASSESAGNKLLYLKNNASPLHCDHNIARSIMSSGLLVTFRERALPSLPADSLRPRLPSARCLILRRKILVVEDNPYTLQLIDLHLSSKGFAVVTAADGREGLDRAGIEQPDLVITDIEMPKLDGISLIRLLRSKKEFESTPIVAMTGGGATELDGAIRAGANRGILKPMRLESLVEHLRELLGSRRAR